MGDSVRRQIEKTEAWCSKHNVTLDQSFNLSDLGVSAFRGKNVQTGALAGFLHAAREGRIPKNRYLIIESLDRLTRNDITPALSLFLSILETGLTIVTHSPERVISSVSINNDTMAILEVIFILSRANEESQIKSQRVGASWET